MSGFFLCEWWYMDKDTISIVFVLLSIWYGGVAAGPIFGVYIWQLGLCTSMATATINSCVFAGSLSGVVCACMLSKHEGYSISWRVFCWILLRVEVCVLILTLPFIWLLLIQDYIVAAVMYSVVVCTGITFYMVFWLLQGVEDQQPDVVPSSIQDEKN